MIRAFAFVTMRSFKNRMLRRLRRLREPRYLVSFIVALIYFWFMFVRRMMRSGGVGDVNLMASDLAVDVIGIIVLVILILGTASHLVGDLTGYSEEKDHFLIHAALLSALVPLSLLQPGNPRKDE